MLKWFIAFAAAVLLALLVISQRNGVKTAYVNGLPEYSSLPNHEFIFEHDCYIFKFKDRDTDWPLVGAQLSVPSLPAEVDPKNIGVDRPEVRLLDIVRAGTHFKLVSVRRDESRRGTFITFEILFLDEQQRKYPRLDAFYLIDHSPEKNGVPQFDERYAVPAVKK